MTFWFFLKKTFVFENKVSCQQHSTWRTNFSFEYVTLSKLLSFIYLSLVWSKYLSAFCDQGIFVLWRTKLSMYLSEVTHVISV